MPDEPLDENGTDSPRRALTRGAGFVFQSVGFILFMGTCCWWPATSCTDKELRSTEPERSIPKILRDAAPEQVWAMAGVVLSFIGGMGLFVLGFGLQQERAGAARLAPCGTGLVALFFWAYLVFSLIRFPATTRIVVVGVMTLVWTALFLLGGAAASEMKRHPPPRRSASGWTQRDEDDLRKTS